MTDTEASLSIFVMDLFYFRILFDLRFFSLCDAQLNYGNNGNNLGQSASLRCE